VTVVIDIMRFLHPIAIASPDVLRPEHQAALRSEAGLDRAISKR
jgi:hypothetical protein